MTEPTIRDFHAHLYYDPEEVDLAKEVAAAARQRFGIPVGHFHLRPVGPHPRGSCQMTVPRDLFGDVRMLAGNAGLMNAFSRRVWRLLRIDGRPSRFRSEPAPVG